jgi:hypothetical protein
MELVEKSPGIQIDVAALREFVELHVLTRPSYFQQKPTWRAWAVTSGNGEVSNIGNFVSKVLDPVSGREVHQFNTQGNVPFTEYTKPTELCRGIVAELLEQLEAHGFNGLFRVRFAEAVPADYSQHPFHVDATHPLKRIHIPIITHPRAYWRHPGGEWHAPADGSVYLLNAHIPHGTVNEGPGRRIHLMADYRQ